MSTDKPSFSQTYIDSTLNGQKIQSIQIYGNEKTKSSVILREMKSKVGDILDPVKLKEDRKRIQNLNLFTRVEIAAVPIDEKAIIQVIVNEQWYFLPYPIFFINERDWGKLSYGAGIIHNNFRGRAELLIFSFWLGYNPSVQLAYANPWLGGNRNLFTQTDLYYKQIKSKHYEGENINENHLGVQWTMGKRFGYHTFLSFTLGYKEITFSPSIPGQTLSPDGKDKLPGLGCTFVWDHRDLKVYPHKGWYVRMSALKTGFPSITADYFKFGFDLRKYFSVGKKPTLAIRASADLSLGTIPVYNRVFLGYGERIRGHFFEKFEGEHRALAGIAFRFPVLPIRYFTISDMPQLRNLQFGISLGLFMETGLIWFQNERVNSSMLISGYGFGIHLHLPYIYILRLEMAFNEYGKKQYILDIGVDI
jgi:outer membrane protein assembly factor BamA